MLITKYYKQNDNEYYIPKWYMAVKAIIRRTFTVTCIGIER